MLVTDYPYSWLLKNNHVKEIISSAIEGLYEEMLNQSYYIFNFVHIDLIRSIVTNVNCANEDKHDPYSLFNSYCNALECSSNCNNNKAK